MQFYEDTWRDIGCRIKIAIRGLLFRQLLTKTWLNTEGHLSNLLTADCEKIYLLPKSSHFLYISPVYDITLVIVIALIYDWDALLAFPVLLIFIMASMFGARLSVFYIKKSLKPTDLRVNAMQQSINGMYTIKTSQMERAVRKLVGSYRREELGFLLRQSVIYALNKHSLVFIMKFPIIIVLIAAYLLIHNGALTASYIFPLALLYQCANVCTHRFSIAVNELLEANLAIGRIAIFLDTTSETNSSEKDMVVQKLISQVIRNPGEFYQICGKTGCGKTTLAESLLSEFSVNLNVAFSAHRAWLLNASIRENILCGRYFDSDRYWRVISVCQLSLDLANNREGDQKMVGENGEKLSGGQRARVNLARTIYTVADAYIFDDPFKSLNVPVASAIFEMGLRDFLRQKTRIVCAAKAHMFSATYGHLFQLQKDVGIQEITQDSTENDSDEVNSYAKDLTEFDSNVIKYAESITEHTMVIDDNPSEHNIQDSTISNSDGLINYNAKLSATSHCDRLNNDLPKSGSIVSDLPQEETPLLPNSYQNDGYQNGNLVQKTYDKGSKQENTQKLFKYFGFAPLWLSCSTLLVILLGQLVLTISDVWLYFWVSCTESCDQWYFFKVYVVIAAAATIICIVRALLLRYLCFVVARNLHNRVLTAVLHAPMSLFWTCRSGDFHSRFSSDMHYVDSVIPRYMDLGIHAFVSVLGYSITIGCLYPYMLLVLFPAFVALFVIRKVGMSIGRETQMLFAKTLAPFVKKFANVASGLTTIRALRLQNYLESDFFALVDCHSRPMLASLRSNTFLLSEVAMVFSIVISILVIAIMLNGGDSSTAGLALYYGIQLLNRCQFAAYYTGYMELIMVHFYRLCEYCQLPSEQEPNCGTFQTPLELISTADICVNHVRVQYKGSPNWAIKDLNLSIKGGKITGLVGRTGCGKSTLLSALLRITKFEGEILLGNLDFKLLSVCRLRNCFAMLPQDSMIFQQENIRWNLDPNEICSEETIWSALDALHMKQTVARLSLGLDTKVSDANLSSGQTRLLCFARVLLNCDGKILLLDEPTDSVDLDTESKIWDAIEQRLINRTVVVVAHSRNLLQKCHRITQMASE